MNKPTLYQVIEGLVKSPTRKATRLSRGLQLAYTPASENEQEPGTFRLVLSRRGGIRPSAKEDEIVYNNLKQALKGLGRRVEAGISLQPNWNVPANGRSMPCTVIVWREYIQEGFPF